MFSEARCNRYNFFRRIVAWNVLFVVIFFVSGCNRGGERDPYLYDRIGNDDFKSLPRNNANRGGYHAQPINNPYYSGLPGQVPNQQQAPQQQQMPQHQVPQRQAPQQQYQQGGSRYYSNPYDSAPSNYNQNPYYYDTDRYYVPPSYYQNTEPQQDQQTLQNQLRDTTTTGY
jgi:hypothetical protein